MIINNMYWINVYSMFVFVKNYFRIREYRDKEVIVLWNVIYGEVGE